MKNAKELFENLGYHEMYQNKHYMFIVEDYFKNET